MKLKNIRVAILAADGFEQIELVEPKKALEQAELTDVSVTEDRDKNTVTLGGKVHSDDAKLARLEGLAASLLEAVEDERDARIADERWEKHLKNKTRLYTGEEVWRELGLPA